MKISKKNSLFILIALLLLTKPVASQPQNSQKCFILLNSKDLTSLLDLKTFIVENDGRIFHIVPPNVIIANITSDIQNELTNRTNVDEVYCYWPIEMPDEEIYGKNVIPITNSWNNNFQVEELNITNITGREGSISGPTEEELYADYVKTKFGLTSEEAQIQGILPPQGYHQTSDYLIGSVAVGIIFPEGPNKKWMYPQQDIAVSKIQNGLDWLGSQEPRASNSWVYDSHYNIPISIDPTDYPHSNYSNWVPEAMQYLGYSGNWTGVYDYLNDIRNQFGTDWSYAIFVVPGNTFTDGWFAFAVGYFVVMTYGLDGYSVFGMPQVTVHETAHDFGVCDEYCDPGYACCGCYNCGYLSIPNSNCEAGCFAGNENGCTSCVWGGSCLFDFQCNSAEYCNVLATRCKPNCIMLDGNRWNLCVHTRQQLGWRDCDGDDILDLMEPAENIGDAGDEPSVAGSCLNSSQWSGCTKTGQLNEYCSGNSVYEYWADGLSCSGDWRNCGNSGCSGTCGTGTNSCTYHARGCFAAACYDNSYDADTQQSYCSSCSQQWNIGGEVAGTNCCGDDSGEKVRTCTKGSAVTENACLVGLDNTACCSASGDCVYNGNCYSADDTHPSFSNLKCRAGKWDYGCNPLYCPSKFCSGGKCSTDPDCAGFSCSPSSSCATPEKCVSDAALAPTCSYTTPVTCRFNPQIGPYCSCGNWATCQPSATDCYDRDANQDSCELTASGCQDFATDWNIGGEVAATTCCGDDCATEYVRTCTKSGVTPDICSASYDNLACCSVNNKCVYKGICYADGSANPDYPCIYCNAGTWVSKTTSTLCNSGYACSAGYGDNNYNAGGSYRCQGYCDGSGNCDYAGNCEDCASKITLDTDGGNYPLTGGTLTDYVSCSLSTCTYNSYYDYCSTNILTEYYPSGATYSSNTYDCESYENLYCNLANGDIYRNEWQCLGSPSDPGHCSDAADALSQDCSSTCSDTDGGISYATNGTVTDKVLCSSGQISCPSDILKTDECLSGNILREYYCSGNDYAYQDYDCKTLGVYYICFKGKCRIQGDVDDNCWVNILDLSIVGKAYGSTPGSPNWDERADLNNDWSINIFDLSLVGKNFGKEC